jgi:hypothetical protein
VQEFHKAKKMVPDPAIQAQEKEKKQGPDLLQHKRKQISLRNQISIEEPPSTAEIELFVA